MIRIENRKEKHKIKKRFEKRILWGRCKKITHHQQISEKDAQKWSILWRHDFERKKK
jgi:hypothetical protein